MKITVKLSAEARSKSMQMGRKVFTSADGEPGLNPNITPAEFFMGVLFIFETLNDDPEYQESCFKQAVETLEELLCRDNPK